MKKLTSRDPLFKIALVSLGHFINDSHGNFLSVFLPSIVGRLGLSLTQAGFLSSIPGIMHVLAQPVTGYFSDRTSRSYMIITGPFITALGASLLPGAANYPLALLFVALWGLGSAIFHPQANGAIGYLGGTDGLAFNLSLFSLAGMLGFTISPVYAIFLYKGLGTLLMPMVTIVPVCITALLFYRFVPVIKEPGNYTDSPDRNIIRALGNVLKKIIRVWALSYARDVTLQGFKFLLPLLIASRGGGIEKIGSILFAITFSSAVMPLAAGRLSLKIEKTKLTLICIGAAPFFLIPAVMTSGFISLLLLMTGNGLLEATNPLTTACAQDLAPGSRSIASSLIMGLCWGLGGLTVALIGFAADIFGITNTLIGVSLLPLIPFPYYLKGTMASFKK